MRICNHQKYVWLQDLKLLIASILGHSANSLFVGGLMTMLLMVEVIESSRKWTFSQTVPDHLKVV